MERRGRGHWMRGSGGCRETIGCGNGPGMG